MPLDMGTRMSRRRLLLAGAGIVGTALVGRLVPGHGALAAGAGRVSSAASGGEQQSLAGASGGGGGASSVCLGAALYEATLHGDETLVLPAVDRWADVTGFYPALLPLWSPFDLELPAPRGGIFPADWLLQGLRERGVEPAVFAHSADERCAHDTGPGQQQSTPAHPRAHVERHRPCSRGGLRIPIVAPGWTWPRRSPRHVCWRSR